MHKGWFSNTPTLSMMLLFFILSFFVSKILHFSFLAIPTHVFFPAISLHQVKPLDEGIPKIWGHPSSCFKGPYFHNHFILGLYLALNMLIKNAISFLVPLREITFCKVHSFYIRMGPKSLHRWELIKLSNAFEKLQEFHLWYTNKPKAIRMVCGQDTFFHWVFVPSPKLPPIAEGSKSVQGAGSKIGFHPTGWCSPKDSLVDLFICQSSSVVTNYLKKGILTNFEFPCDKKVPQVLELLYR
jgi:hypothetical protein